MSNQSKSRFHRPPQKVVLVIDDMSIERRIAERLAAKLASNDLPILVIQDETVKLKSGETLLFPCQQKAVDRLLEDWGLDKK